MKSGALVMKSPHHERVDYFLRFARLGLASLSAARTMSSTPC